MRRPTVVFALFLATACGSPTVEPPGELGLVGTWCGVDTCETTFRYSFSGTNRAVFERDAAPTVHDEPSKPQPFITGTFTFAVWTHGTGGGAVSFPADGFSLEYQQIDFATRWIWEPDSSRPEAGHICRLQRSEVPFDPDKLSEDVVKDATTRSECAAAAFMEINLPLVEPSETAGAVIDLDGDQLRASNEVTDYRSELAEGGFSYGPFILFRASATTVAADSSGSTIWASHWDGETQWTFTSLS